MPQLATLKGVLFPSLVAATSGTGTPANVPVTSKDLNVYAKGSGTISSGTILIEEADDPTFTGTWSLLSTIDATTLTAGAQAVVHIAGLVRAVRARLSVAIGGGGNVSVDFVSS